ncbi:putative J domain-containing protein [Smittium culicis]|uniref:Putative J domain-containing protein n=2 Tax=Smittium culicis TaxID=133412 RepID=A0A1R1YNG9_9FUNG|nr:putative J domain-containing protein [Smittium culicis]
MLLGKKSLLFLFIFVASLFQVVKAWEDIDIEIFELWDSIKKHDGTTDWYSFVGVKENDSLEDINRAFRRVGIKYHPDKLRGNPKEKKKASDKFARMSNVVNILRNNYKRKRYNFFKKNGVPSWRGAGYMYKRFRPGVGSVLVGVSIFAAIFQYLFMWLSFWRAQQRIKEIEEDEKAAAAKKNSGNSRTNSHRFQQGPYSMEPEFFDEENEVMYIGGSIDPYSVPAPNVKDLFLIKLPMFFVNKVLTSVGLKKAQVEIEYTEVDDQEDYDENEYEDSNLSAPNKKSGKKAKSSNSQNGSDSRENSTLSSDNEFNAVLVKKNKSVSKENSADLSSSSRKSLKKRRNGPIV